MNSTSRIENSIKNTIVSLSAQIMSILLNFVGRTIFIKILGANYLGVSGLFSNILSMLSLAELGVGSAITFSLYRPVAEKNERKIRALMNMYATIYMFIGFTVAALGLTLIPFLDIIIKNKPDIPHITIIYLLYLASSVITYFFGYKRSLIQTDQKAYIDTINQYSFLFIQNIVQIIVLLTTKNFILYLVVQFICNFCANISISLKVDKLYPFLKMGKKEHLNKIEKKVIFKNMGALMSHRVGGVIVYSTDNILISYYIGIYWVGLYSNYIMIIGIINNILGQVFASLTASVGNLTATEESNKSFNVFNTIFFINFWLYSFCAISLWILLNPFIRIWIGSMYLMDSNIIIIIILNFFIIGMRQTVIIFKTTYGLFWNDRYKPLVEASINLVASMILLDKIGIQGVFLGTFISTIATSFWIEPYVLYKHGFKKPLILHFTKYGLYTMITIFAAIITQFASSIFTENTLLSLFGKGIFCLIIPNFIFILVFYKTTEFKQLQILVKRMIKTVMRKK